MSGLGETLRESAVINLAAAVTMVVDDSSFALDLTAQALLGFGIRTRYACRSAATAMAYAVGYEWLHLSYHLDPESRIGRTALIRWLRRSGLEPNAFVPVILTAAHIRRPRVTEARDCGASFIITKPFSAATLLERIVWVARDGRPFLEVGDYFGPDRRFRTTPAPREERRADLIRKREFEAQKGATAAEGETG